MYCLKCGAQMPNEARFCPDCGEPVRLTANEAPPVYQPAEWGDMQQGIKKKKSKKTILIIAASVFVFLCIILIPVLIEAPKAARYKEAIALMDSGETAQAKDALLKLGSYKKSEDLAKDCQNLLDFNAAKEQMEAGDFALAIQTFEKLGDYGEARAMVEECQNGMDYKAAVVLMDAEKNEEAKEAFLKLGSYKDSSQLAELCGNKLDYDAAKSLMDNENYDAALTAFKALDNYSDAAVQAQECQNRIDYNAAVTAFNQGLFYAAYTQFNNLNGYADSSAQAASCIQNYPSNGQLYRNEEYSSTRCPLTITNSDDGYATFLKFYSDNGALVATFFLAPGKKAKIKLPTGTFKIKSAYGSQWFGPDEMFGDEGVYQLMLFENGADTTVLSSNYVYSLKLRAGDGNVGTQNLDRNNF